jgi:hypothetical protein
MMGLPPAVADNAVMAAVVGAVVTAVLGGAGYLIHRWFFERDRSDLSVSLRDVIQAEPLLGGQPSLGGRPVYCSGVQALLVLEHNRKGRRPISIHRVAVETEPVSLSPEVARSLARETDVLGTTPHGIVDVRLYVVGLSAASPWARYEVDRTEAYDVSPRNLLERAGRREVVALEPDAPPTALQIRLRAGDAGLTRARFAVHYAGAGGETVVVTTDWLQIYKAS